MFICSVRANEQSFSAPNPFLSAHVLPHFVSHSHDLQLTLDIFGHVWTSLDILGKSKANCRGRSVHLSGIPPSKLDGLGLAGPLCGFRMLSIRVEIDS